MEPAHQPPPLTRWSHVWRYTLVLVISGLSWSTYLPWQWRNDPYWLWADATLGVITLVLLRWRRSHPVAVAVAANLATFVSASAGGPATLALVSLATRRRWREIIPVSVLALAAGLVLELTTPVAQEPAALTIPLLMLVVAVTVGWGLYIGSRRELLATLRLRAETAEAEQASRSREARTAERTRIAREMHDVLAHRISLVTMHAGALAYRDDLDGDQVRQTAAVIQENSHQAMIELREVLGILRDGPGDAAPELPQPSAGDVPALIDEARATGMRVTFTSDVALDVVPETLGRTLYRVVQEGLTNARKHAAGTTVGVVVDGSEPGGMHVRVQNPLPFGPVGTSARSGLGLVGLSERAELVGGRLDHRMTADDLFELDAWLPWSP